MMNATSRFSSWGKALPAFAVCLFAALPGCGPFGSAPNADSSSIKQSGCSAADSMHVAPGGYYVSGNTVCTAAGRPHIMRGVARPSLEWSSCGQSMSAADFQHMGETWKANIVRLALNQDFWLQGSPIYDEKYPQRVDQAISWAEQAGMDVIVDLHWSDLGDFNNCVPKPCAQATCPVPDSCKQQPMADAHSIDFWTQVATRYKGDGRVLFELYNEPHDVSVDVWRNGGQTSQGFLAAGMQQLYNAVRATGAENLVVVGGLSFAYDLSFVPDHALDGYNIMYATHPYASSPDKQPGAWDGSWGLVTRNHPVIVTEFGDNKSGCTGDYDAELIDYADSHSAGWTAWAWYNAGAGGVCSFPSILQDSQGTPSVPGQIVKAALIRLNASDPPASSPAAPGGGRPNQDLCVTSSNMDDGGLDDGASSDAASGDAGIPGEAGESEGGAGEAGDLGADADGATADPDSSSTAEGGSQD